jgi:hypothetical protein
VGQCILRRLPESPGQACGLPDEPEHRRRLRLHVQ